MFAPDSPEPYPGCKTNYTGTCTTDTEVVASTALIEADRDLIIDSPVFSNVGATTLAGGNIDIATNDFFNGQRDYQATWSAEYSAKPFQQAFSGTSCTTCEASIDWSRTAAGTVPLGSIAGNIQAGNVFSVDTHPRSGQPAIMGNTGNSTAPTSGTSNTSSPPTNTPSVTATLAQAITQGAGSVDAAPPALSKFINTGNINAAAIVVKADDIRNGFDTVKDYYQRTGAPQLPPSTIAVANYGTAGTTGAGTYSGAALMQVLPPALASSAPFALTPAEEQAALRNAFLATTGRAWILPGLTWDPATGQSPADQQQAILAANGAAFALEHGIPVGGALTPAQQAQLGAPVLWYVNQGGSLIPTVYLPASWQQQLINLPGGKLDGDVAISLTARHVDNTGFVISDGQLSIDAEALENQKRNAYYYEKRDVEGGTLKIWGDTVQGGGFMQAAQWNLNADKVYSRSGEFVVTGADAAETASLTSAFEAQIRAELGDSFVFEEAHDKLQTKFKADSGGMGLIAAVVVIVASMFIGPAISALIGNIAGAAAGTTFAAATATTTAGLGNMAIGSFVTGTLSNAIGQSVATGQVDWNSALKSGAVSGFTAGLTNAPVFDGQSLNQMAGVGSLSGTQQSVADGTSGIDATRFAGLAGRAVVNAGVSSAIYGTSFGDALKNNLINDVAAIGANTVGRNTDALTPGNVIYHAMVGAAAAELRGEDPAAAALGAATAALINPLADDFTSATDETTRTAQHAAIATLMAGLVARAAGKDEGTAIGAAQNETFNNFLTQENIEEKYARLAGAQTVAERREILAQMQVVDRENRSEAVEGIELISTQIVLGQEKSRLQTLLDGSNACTANPACVTDAQRSIAQIDQILAAPDIAERLVPYRLAAEVALGLLPVSSVLEAEIVGRWSVNGAQNIANGPRLAQQLTHSEAASIFVNGGLRAEVIAGSKVAIPGSQLNNPALVKALTTDGSKITDWAKMTSQTFKSPSGPFQVHFYQNLKTGATHFADDFKAVFNHNGAWP
ncbi:DUF637 domain-containing protein [Denitromonas sp.]|uniref:DUF637 domain-containing protein n=1 Tax=Denitromonas sp. TaxID=2734609 RepID=UPI002AFDE295|nr:DUF637 domain-containing protein [Denitromonas sp.]